MEKNNPMTELPPPIVEINTNTRIKEPHTRILFSVALFTRTAMSAIQKQLARISPKDIQVSSLLPAPTKTS